ncbi:MAG: hypothetical protein Kow0010_11880 [Dehalococcoidia bacterium]
MMVFRTPKALTPDEERALRRRLSPLADVAPSGEGLVRMHAAIARGLTRPDVARSPGLRAWQRATVVGVALALPLAAGGVLAAMPGSPVGGIPGNVLGNLGPVGRFAADDGSPPPQLSPAGNGGDERNGGDQVPGGNDGGTPGDETVSAVTDDDAGTLGHDGDGAATAGHDACSAATAHARALFEGVLARDDLPDEAREGLEAALAALEACGTGGGQDGGGEENGDGPGRGHQACSTATVHAQEVVAGLMGVAGGNGVAGFERALEAIDACGEGSGADGGESADGVGEPLDTPQANRPSHAGPPPDVGQPEAVGSNDRSEGPGGPPPVAPGGPPEGVVPGNADGQGPGAHPHGATDHPGGIPAEGAGPPDGYGPVPTEGTDNAPGPPVGVGGGPPGGTPTDNPVPPGGPPTGAGPGGGYGR